MSAWLCFKIIFLFMNIALAGPIFYLCLLSLAAVRRSKKLKKASTHGQEEVTTHARIAILVPAYNEETSIRTVLNSTSALDYPQTQYTVHVIADNCTDNTAKLAREIDRVQVHERFDQVKRGKGYALNWLFQKLAEDQDIYDAYVVLDADSVVEPRFLQAMNRDLGRGARALQGQNNVLNTSEAPSTVLRWIALTLINHIRPLGRNALGASSTLTGNGMCLSHALLQQYPWQAFSVTEDYQYYLNLILHGEVVRYVPDAIVRSHMPTTFAQMRTQDIRWEASETSQSTRSVAISLLKAGLYMHDWRRLEAIAELLTPPLSLLIALCLFSLVIALVLWSPPLILLSLALLGSLVGYICTALYFLRPPRAIYIALLHAPVFMIWKIWIYVVLRKKKQAAEWIRTDRAPVMK